MKVNEVLGQWRMKYMISFDEDLNAKHALLEDLAADKDDKELKIMSITIMEFTPDGNIDMKIPIEKTGYTVEQVEADGMKVKDGYVMMDSNYWKEKDGEVYADTGLEGEVLGEKVDGWEKLSLNEDGLLPVLGGMYLCEKIL